MFGQFIKKRMLRTPEWRSSRPETPHSQIRKNSDRPTPFNSRSNMSPTSSDKAVLSKSEANSVDSGVSDTLQRWQRRLNARMMAVFSSDGETRVGVLRINDVQEINGHEETIRVSVNELQLSEDGLASNSLIWMDQIELDTKQILYFEVLKRELDVRELPAYRTAIQRLATVATLLEMESNLD